VAINDYSDDLRCNGFVLIRDFVARDQVASLWATCCTAPVHRCHAGDEVRWSEATLPSGHPGHEFFQQPHVRELVDRLAPVDVAPEVFAWVSLYHAGEFIVPHRDSDGLLQVLACLESPSDVSSGGILVLAGRDVFLRPGDAVIFAATDVEHYTTPLRRTVVDPDPVRTVLVGRYFARVASDDVERR
jgi:hypothetical protein